MAILKKKIISSSFKNEQISLLTMSPWNWRHWDFFGVTNYMVRKSRTLKKEKETLAKRKEEEGKSRPADIIKQVQDFYQSDEVSWMCSGKKDLLPVKIDGIKQHNRNIFYRVIWMNSMQTLNKSLAWKYMFQNFASYAPSGVLQLETLLVFIQFVLSPRMPSWFQYASWVNQS